MLEFVQKNYGWIIALLGLSGFAFRTWLKANPQDAERYKSLDTRLKSVEDSMHEMEKTVVGIKHQIEALPNAVEFREHTNKLAAIISDVGHLREGIKGLSDMLHDFVAHERLYNAK
jgi:uncharacterized Ntn-hydrolase superfamily protein